MDSIGRKDRKLYKLNLSFGHSWNGTRSLIGILKKLDEVSIKLPNLDHVIHARRKNPSMQIEILANQLLE
jgi:hypothetical protein